MTLPIPSSINLGNPRQLKKLGKAIMKSSPFAKLYEMSGKDTPDEMLELLILAKKNLKGIEIEFGKHHAVELEPHAKDLIGYFPSGEFHMLFKKNGRVISCIRGAISFGAYEICGIKGFKTKGNLERFGDPKDVVKRIRALLS